MNSFAASRMRRLGRSCGDTPIWYTPPLAARCAIPTWPRMSPNPRFWFCAAGFGRIAKISAGVVAHDDPGFALDAIKKQTRRTHYEREAAMATPEVREPAEIPDVEVAAFLDDAMSRLAARECTALGIRYLQDRPINDVAAAMGVSPNAAQKILSRSLVKLRKILGRRGVIVPSTAVLTAALLHESARTAPASIVISSVSSSGSSLSIAKGVIHMIFLTKIKLAVGVMAASIFLVGTGSFVAIRAMGQTPPTDVAAPPSPIAASPVAPSAVPYENPFFELVGCRIKETLRLKLTADVCAAG